MVSPPQRYNPVPLPAHYYLPPVKAQAEAENFLGKMSKRHSIRDFSDVDVDENVIRTAIRTATRAPSGANQQPWHFVAIKNAKKNAGFETQQKQKNWPFTMAVVVMSG